MKFAPTVAYQVNHWLSIGAAFNISYSTLDLRNGADSGFAPGAQIGAIIKPHKDVSIGLTYTTPQDINHHNVLLGPPGYHRRPPLPEFPVPVLAQQHRRGGELGCDPQEAPLRDGL